MPETLSFLIIAIFVYVAIAYMQTYRYIGRIDARLDRAFNEMCAMAKQLRILENTLGKLESHLASRKRDRRS